MIMEVVMKSRMFRCPLCGEKKSIDSFDMQNYAYKVNGKAYCSYRCYSEALKNANQKKYNKLVNTALKYANKKEVKQ